MRHCDDAAAAQAVIAEIEAQRNDARLRPRRRRAAARQPRRVRRRRDALELAARRAGVQVRRRGEDDGAGRRAVGRRQDGQDRAGRAAGAGVRGRDDGHAARRWPTRRSSGRAASRSATPCWCAARATSSRSSRACSTRRSARAGARDRPAVGVPVVRAAADRAGQLARAVLHQRRLPRPDRAAADPLGVTRGGGHRGGRSGVDRAARRVPATSSKPSDFYGLTKEQPARVRAHRRGLAPSA